MCIAYQNIKPMACLFSVSTVLTVFIFLMHLNYFISYGPLTLVQEQSYYLTFTADAIIIIMSVVALVLLQGTKPMKKNDYTIPIVINLGFISAAVLLLGAAIMFAEDTPTIDRMQMYLSHKFNDKHQNLMLLERLQMHQDGEPGALNCCGIESPLDYTKTHLKLDQRPFAEGVQHVINVPDSCCVHVREGCGIKLSYPENKTDPPLIFHEGCLKGGLQPFVDRLDFFTGFFFRSVGYVTGFMFVMTLIWIGGFDVFYFCTPAPPAEEEEEAVAEKPLRVIIASGASYGGTNIKERGDDGVMELNSPGFGSADTMAEASSANINVGVNSGESVVPSDLILERNRPVKETLPVPSLKPNPAPTINPPPLPANNPNPAIPPGNKPKPLQPTNPNVASKSKTANKR